jgi:hypothetical protein
VRRRGAAPPDGGVLVACPGVPGGDGRPTQMRTVGAAPSIASAAPHVSMGAGNASAELGPMTGGRPAALRRPATLYIAGGLALGYTEFYSFLIPLYGLSLGMSAAQVGLLVGARSILSVFLSIHVGVLMDRFGTRRVALFFVWTAIALAPVFPLVPGF